MERLIVVIDKETGKRIAIDEKTGKRVNNIKVTNKEINQVKSKVSEVLEKITDSYGNISGLTFAEFGEIIIKPEYEEITKNSIFEFDYNLDEYEMMKRALIVKEVLIEYGIKF